jgi:hypothetical protein
MKANFRMLASTFSALVVALACTPLSWAGCAPNMARPTHSSWLVQPGGPTLLEAALDEDRDHMPVSSACGT